jgi:hypothetical protein
MLLKQVKGWVFNMKYKIGDKVKIKFWDRLVSQFGIDCNGDIPCDGHFVKSMNHLCGKVWTIEQLTCSGYYILNDEKGTWNISDDMIECLVSEDHPSDSVNHPSHYNRDDSMECINEMVAVFGKEAVMNFCLCNVWKYRYRASDKNGEEDLKKSDWYMMKYVELKGDLE